MPKGFTYSGGWILLLVLWTFFFFSRSHENGVSSSRVHITPGASELSHSHESKKSMRDSFYDAIAISGAGACFLLRSRGFLAIGRLSTSAMSPFPVFSFSFRIFLLTFAEALPAVRSFLWAFISIGAVVATCLIWVRSRMVITVGGTACGIIHGTAILGTWVKSAVKWKGRFGFGLQVQKELA